MDYGEGDSDANAPSVEVEDDFRMPRVDDGYDSKAGDERTYFDSLYENGEMYADNDFGKWRIHSARLADAVTWAIKSLTSTHTCTRMNMYNSMATPEWAATKIVEHVRANEEITGKSINNLLFQRYGVRCTAMVRHSKRHAKAEQLPWNGLTKEAQAKLRETIVASRTCKAWVVPDAKQWPPSDFPIINPPPMKKVVRRPARNRRRKEGEKEKGKRSRTVQCGKCKAFGHNSKTCKGGLTAREAKEQQGEQQGIRVKTKERRKRPRKTNTKTTTETIVESNVLQRPLEDVMCSAPWVPESQ